MLRQCVPHSCYPRAKGCRAAEPESVPPVATGTSSGGDGALLLGVIPSCRLTSRQHLHGHGHFEMTICSSLMPPVISLRVLFQRESFFAATSATGLAPLSLLMPQCHKRRRALSGSASSGADPYESVAVDSTQEAWLHCVLPDRPTSIPAQYSSWLDHAGCSA